MSKDDVELAEPLRRLGDRASINSTSVSSAWIARTFAPSPARGWSCATRRVHPHCRVDGGGGPVPLADLADPADDERGEHADRMDAGKRTARPPPAEGPRTVSAMQASPAITTGGPAEQEKHHG